MIFRKSKKEVEKSMKRMDSLVTGLIVWGAVASIFGLSRTKKWKKITSKILATSKTGFKYGYAMFWKTLAETVSFFFKKK